MRLYNLTNMNMLGLFNIENVLSQVAELPPVSSTPIRQTPAKQNDEGFHPSMLCANSYDFILSNARYTPKIAHNV